MTGNLPKVARFALAVAFVVLGGSALALAGADDRAAAASILTALDADAAHKSLVAEAVREARAALERGARMRSAGDEPHARLADSLAREWAELGRDLVATVDLEKRATDARRNATDAGAHAERERALLEEGIATNGRLRAELEAAERETSQEPEKTAKVGASLDAGAPAPRSKLPVLTMPMQRPVLRGAPDGGAR